MPPAPPSAESVAFDHAILQEFRGTKFFDVLYKYADLMSDDLAARLINDVHGDLGQIRLIQGMLQGLKMALDIPESVENLFKLGQNGTGT